MSINRWACALLVLLGIALLPAGAARTTAQPRPSQPTPSGEEIGEPPGDEISPADQQAMWAEIQRNLARLRRAGMLPAQASAQATSLGWPLRLAPGLPGSAGFRVSAFVDHNASGGQIRDYNNGTRTYDGHRGTDIALYPFSWNKLDAGDVQVIAAAAGTIVALANGDPTDHNCNVASSDPWNYVALRHADGRMTIYGHLRYNSLTSKQIGQTVDQGEYLGLVGSSGNSSGPHLHFEVRYGSYSAAEWADPYAGPASQAQSLWASQRPYRDTAINLVAAHSAPPSTPNPCQATITNLQDSFTTPSTIYLYTYYRDYQGALATQRALYRPDGSLFRSSQYAPGTSQFSSAWSNGWAISLASGEPAGTWRFEATYNGQTAVTYFNVNAPPAVALSSPNGSEQWAAQVGQALAWSDTIGGDVNITLRRNGAYSTTIASNTPSDGAYLWIPELTLALGAGYTIRVTSVTNPAVYDESDAAFSLLPSSLVPAVYLPAARR